MVVAAEEEASSCGRCGCRRRRRWSRKTHLCLVIVVLMLVLLLLLLEHGVLEGQVVAPIDEQLISEMRGWMHVLTGVARAAALDAVVAGDHAPV